MAKVNDPKQERRAAKMRIRRTAQSYQLIEQFASDVGRAHDSTSKHFAIPGVDDNGETVAARIDVGNGYTVRMARTVQAERGSTDKVVVVNYTVRAMTDLEGTGGDVGSALGDLAARLRAVASTIDEAVARVRPTPEPVAKQPEPPVRDALGWAHTPIGDQCPDCCCPLDEGKDGALWCRAMCSIYIKAKCRGCGVDVWANDGEVGDDGCAGPEESFAMAAEPIEEDKAKGLPDILCEIHESNLHCPDCDRDYCGECGLDVDTIAVDYAPCLLCSHDKG